VTDDECAAAVRQVVDDPAERSAEPRRVLRHELGVGLAERWELAAPRPLSDGLTLPRCTLCASTALQPGG
jgi:hypothetical protein